MNLALASLARKQGGVFTREQAIAHHSRREFDANVRAKRWVLIRRGVYATRQLVEWSAADPVRQHRLECAARLLVTAGDPLISHESAAILFRIPLRDPFTGTAVTVATPRPTTAGGVLGRYLAQVPSHHRTTYGGILPILTPARAVADLCRTSDTRAALVVADGALRQGVERADVLAVLDDCRRWPLVLAAREVMTLASRWSESALESLSLHWCRVHGLPAPEQQLTVRTEGGVFVARVDLVWEAHRTVAELDGRMKYESEGDDRRPARVFWDEKQREDRLRDLGLEVVRGYWSDDADCGAAFVERVRRAFARGSERTLPPTYRICDERDHAHRGPLAA